MESLLDKVCGQHNWKCFIINLKRATKRREQVSQFLKDIGLQSFEFFEAVDKIDLMKQGEQTLKYNAKINGNHEYGVTACKMSHENLYDYFLDTCKEEYLFVLEDDAGFVLDYSGFGKNPHFQNYRNLEIFMNELSQVPKHIWNSITFGLSYNVSFPFTDNITLTRRTDLTHAMIFNRSACHYMLGVINDRRYYEMPVDHVMSVLRGNNTLVTLSPKETIIDQVNNQESFIWEKVSINQESSNEEK